MIGSLAVRVNVHVVMVSGRMIGSLAVRVTVPNVMLNRMLVAAARVVEVAVIEEDRPVNTLKLSAFSMNCGRSEANTMTLSFPMR